MRKKRNDFDAVGAERMTDGRRAVKETGRLSENGEHQHIAGRFTGDRRVYFNVYTA